MKINALNLRPGNVIDFNGKLWVILKAETLQPGKGASVVQVEMRDIKAGTKDNVRFRTQETVEKAHVEEADYQFLYSEEEKCHFMNTETFEQMEVDKELIGYPVVFLQEGMIVRIAQVEANPVRVDLPENVTVEIVESEPVVKGQTASSSYKPAIADNGEKIMVPPHIEAGARVVVKSRDGSYVEKAKD